MKYYANLHTHSTHSDGKYTPAQLAQMALAEGYGAVAVTDHDTVTGYGELKAECDKLGLETVFGAEFSAPTDLFVRENGFPADFHIMGFHFDPEYPAMQEYLAGMSLREADQTRILTEPDEAKRDGYIALISLAKRALEECIDLLGFSAPDRM